MLLFCSLAQAYLAQFGVNAMIYDEIGHLRAYAALHPALNALCDWLEAPDAAMFPAELPCAICRTEEIALSPKDVDARMYEAGGRETVMYIALSDGEDMRYAPASSMLEPAVLPDGRRIARDCANWTTVHLKKDHFVLLFPWDACQRGWMSGERITVSQRLAVTLYPEDGADGKVLSY